MESSYPAVIDSLQAQGLITARTHEALQRIEYAALLHLTRH